MRKIAIVGVDTESETVECEIADTGEKLALPLDDTLRAAAQGRFGDDKSESDASGETSSAAENSAEHSTLPEGPEPSLVGSASTTAPTNDGGDADTLASTSSRPEPGGRRPSARFTLERNALRPKDLQARVRAGATVEELCELTGMSFTRVEAFAYPILQERGARAERARNAHPLLADGPSVDTVETMVIDSLEERGVDPELLRWDSWLLKSGNWTVQATWPAGLSDDATALWEFVPDSHGGVAHPMDDEAVAIGDPELRKPLGLADDAEAEPEVGPDAGSAHGGGSQWPRSFPASVTGIGGRRVPHDPSSQSTPYVLGRPIELDPNAGRPGAAAAQASGGGAAPGGRPGAQANERTGDRAGTMSGNPFAQGLVAPQTRPHPEPRNGRPPAEQQRPTDQRPGGSGGANGRENHENQDDDFLKHPPTEGGAHRAKGKHPTMPSWEDVLLGVRSPKDSK